jgi:hypothetical protein
MHLRFNNQFVFHTHRRIGMPFFHSARVCAVWSVVAAVKPKLFGLRIPVNWQPFAELVDEEEQKAEQEIAEFAAYVAEQEARVAQPQQ